MTASLRRLLACATVTTLAAASLAAGSVVAAPQAQAADNSCIAYNFFVGKGFKSYQAAGLVGNFVVESGRDPINPASVQNNGKGPGHGIAQWEDKGRYARMPGLIAYGKRTGRTDWRDLQLQLDFVWYEMNTTEQNAKRKLLAARNSDEAAYNVRKYYERPRVHHDAKRQAAARQVLARCGKGAPAPAPSSKPTTKPTGQQAETAVPTLRQNSKGAAVSELQYLLNAKGAKLTVDGQFGPATATAVKTFQKNNGLGQDGVVGSKTWGKLLPTLKAGAKGDAVRALQTALRAQRYTAVSITGTFDGATAAAVKQFQGKSGLAVDGVVGPKTWGALID